MRRYFHSLSIDGRGSTRTPTVQQWAETWPLLTTTQSHFLVFSFLQILDKWEIQKVMLRQFTIAPLICTRYLDFHSLEPYLNKLWRNYRMGLFVILIIFRSLRYAIVTSADPCMHSSIQSQCPCKKQRSDILLVLIIYMKYFSILIGWEQCSLKEMQCQKIKYSAIFEILTIFRNWKILLYFYRSDKCFFAVKILTI